MANLQLNPPNGVQGSTFTIAAIFDESVQNFAETNVNAVAANINGGDGATGWSTSVSGTGDTWYITYTLEASRVGTAVGGITVSIVGMVTTGTGSDSQSEGIMANSVTVYYDTRISPPDDIFGTPVYNHINTDIVLPVSLLEGRVWFRSDFVIQQVAGDTLKSMEYFLNGSDGDYTLTFQPALNKKGSFSVFLNEGGISGSKIIQYDSSAPRIVDYVYTQVLAEGVWELLIIFNVPIIDLSVDSFLIEGVNAAITHIFRATDLVTQPASFPSGSASEGGWVREYLDRKTTERGKFFVLRFNLPADVSLGMNLFLKDRSVASFFSAS